MADLHLAPSEADSRLSALRSTNLAVRAASAVVDAIASGALKPGQRLIETEIAADLGVSRLPVREAFKMLATQGIVELSQHRGAKVCQIDPDRVETVRTARTTLEQLAFPKAAAAYRADPSGLRILDSIIELMKRAEERADLSALNHLDVEFHRSIVAAAQEPFLAALWEALALHLRIVFAWEVKKLPRPVSYAGVHLAIRYALARGDDQELKTLVADHIAGRSDLEGDPGRGIRPNLEGRK